MQSTIFAIPIMNPDLTNIASETALGVRMDQYTAKLEQGLQSGDPAELKAFIDHVSSDAVPLPLSRQLLSLLASSVPRVPTDYQESVATYALERLLPRAVSYDAQVASLREALSRVYENAERWSAAAEILSGIDVAGGDAPGALERSVHVAALYLEDDDAVSAERFVKKAAQLAQGCTDKGLLLRYRACQARVLDARRRFLEAAGAYYELSRAPQPELVSHEDAMQALAAAVRCGVLSSAGARRSRLLSLLIKDERTLQLPTRAFLEKVALERMLTDRGEVEGFAATLAPHQRALLPDGKTTVLDRAVMEHNLESASRLYTCVRVDGLARLLGVEPLVALRAAAAMALEGRLQAVIDEVDGVVRFTGQPSAAARRDAALQGACAAAASLVDRMIDKGIVERRNVV